MRADVDLEFNNDMCEMMCKVDEVASLCFAANDIASATTTAGNESAEHLVNLVFALERSADAAQKLARAVAHKYKLCACRMHTGAKAPKLVAAKRAVRK